jgi:hypothetical protein
VSLGGNRNRLFVQIAHVTKPFALSQRIIKVHGSATDEHKNVLNLLAC